MDILQKFEMRLQKLENDVGGIKRSNVIQRENVNIMLEGGEYSTVRDYINPGLRKGYYIITNSGDSLFVDYNEYNRELAEVLFEIKNLITLLGGNETPPAVLSPYSYLNSGVPTGVSVSQGVKDSAELLAGKIDNLIDKLP